MSSELTFRDSFLSISGLPFSATIRPRFSRFVVMLRTFPTEGGSIPEKITVVLKKNTLKIKLIIL